MLYVAQGIPWGFTSTTIPAYLTGHGVTGDLIGAALSLTTLPYAFKWAFGPIIDTVPLGRHRHRRPWILLAQGMMAVTILAMLALPDLTRDLAVLQWMILIHTVFNALQDVAVDALAVDVLDESERATGNGLMYASKYVGGFLGGFGLATVIDWIDLRVALVVQGAILLAIMLTPLLIPERATRDSTPSLAVGGLLADLANAFSVRSAIACALVMSVVNFAQGLLSANAFGLFIQRLHWDPGDYTRLVGGYGLLIGAIGASVGGVLARLFGAKRIAAIGSIGMAAGWIGFGSLTSYWDWEPLGYLAIVWEGSFQATMVVALFAICMDQTWPRVGASQFAAYMALANVGTTIGYALAGQALEHLEYEQMYLLGGALQLAITFGLLAITPGQTRLVAVPGRKIAWWGPLVLIAMVLGLGYLSVRPLIKLLL